MWWRKVVCTLHCTPPRLFLTAQPRHEVLPPCGRRQRNAATLGGLWKHGCRGLKRHAARGASQNATVVKSPSWDCPLTACGKG